MAYGSTIKDEYYENPIEINEFSNKSWEEAKGEIDFTPPEIKKKQEEEARNNNTGNANSSNRGNTSNRRSRNYADWDLGLGENIGASFFKMLLMIVGILLVSVLVFRLAGGTFETETNKKNIVQKGVAGTVNIRNVEENLHKSDMEILIDQSLADKNYMMAIRLYYLWAIKELSNKKLIKWKRDKTNRDYIREMRKTDLNKSFREVTRIFERVWYGQQEQLDQSDYLPIQKKLNDFVQQVKKR